MKTLLCTTAISTLMLSGAFAQETQEVENPEQYVEPGVELPAEVDQLQEDELDEVDSATKLNKIVLETTTEEGLSEDGSDMSDPDMDAETDSDIDTDADGQRQMMSPNASTTPDMPTQEMGGSNQDMDDMSRRMNSGDMEEDSDMSDQDMDAEMSDQDMDSDMSTTDMDADPSYGLADDQDDANMQSMPNGNDGMMGTMDQTQRQPAPEMKRTNFGGEASGADIIDADIYGSDGEPIAQLVDVILDEEGMASDAIIDSRATGNLDGRTYVVAFTDLQTERDGDELRFMMDADRQSVEALAPWSRDDFTVGDNGRTLLSELRDADLRLASSEDTVEVEDIIMSSEGRLTDIVVAYDDDSYALDYDDVSVDQGAAAAPVGYAVAIAPAQFSSMTPYQGGMDMNRTDRTREMDQRRGFDMEAESADAVYNDVDGDLADDTDVKTYETDADTPPRGFDMEAESAEPIMEDGDMDAAIIERDLEADDVDRETGELRRATGGALRMPEEELNDEEVELERSYQRTEREAVELGNELERETEEFENEFETEAAETATEAEMLGNDIDRETTEFGNDLERETDQFGNDIEAGVDATEREATELGNDIEAGAEATTREAREFGNDVEEEATEFGNDVAGGLEEAGDAVEEETDEMVDGRPNN